MAAATSAAPALSHPTTRITQEAGGLREYAIGVHKNKDGPSKRDDRGQQPRAGVARYAGNAPVRLLCRLAVRLVVGLVVGRVPPRASFVAALTGGLTNIGNAKSIQTALQCPCYATNRDARNFFKAAKKLESSSHKHEVG